MTNEERYRRILANHLPPDKEVHDCQGVNRLVSAVDWVYDYLNLHKVHFHITLERMSKLGDYRRPSPDHNFHEISINGDLNPYFFLWVFLHEAAHLETYLKYTSHLSPLAPQGRRPQFTSHLSPSPHGHEWQEEYRQLLIAHANLFPPEVQPFLKKYTRRIPLSHPVAKEIEAALHRYNADFDPDLLTLDQLAVGDQFRLKNKPDLLFETLEKRRTRWLCRDLTSHRQYLVNGSAEIMKC